MSKASDHPKLWTPRSVAETVEIYQDWAATYDQELADWGYMSPARLAAALAIVVPLETPILDFGCGTGLSGAALKTAGFNQIDGTDITAEMLAKAKDRGIYRSLWIGDPDRLDIPQNAYEVIFAAGVISLGAAPATLLEELLARLPTGGILAFSYNEPTLNDAVYMAALDSIFAHDAKLVTRENGPHLANKGMNSDIIIVRKT